MKIAKVNRLQQPYATALGQPGQTPIALASSSAINYGRIVTKNSKRSNSCETSITTGTTLLIIQLATRTSIN